MTISVEEWEDVMTYKLGGNGKIRIYDFVYFIILITPFIDTINGAYVRSHGETGTSIGTFYRMAILLCILILIRLKDGQFKWIIALSYFPISSLIRARFEGVSTMSAFSYGLKWLFPVIIISGLLSIYKNSSKNIPLWLLSVWKYLIPSILIFEYMFNIGDVAYPDAGWRGLFYCNNDIAFSLTVMAIISLYEFIVVKTCIINSIPVVLNALAIMILSTKSCLIFFGLSGMYFVYLKFRDKPIKTFPIIGILVFIIMAVVVFMQDSIEGILSRYIIYYNMAMTTPSFGNFMAFLTSNRTPRIVITVNKLWRDFSISGLFFGWIKPTNVSAIEMDWLDALFQHGILGLGLLVVYYGKLLIRRYRNKMMSYTLFIVIVCSFFSGHVINGALPSTVFAVLVGYVLNENHRLSEENKVDELYKNK